MTGFGRGEHVGKLKQVTVEIRSINHRFGEVQIKMPRQYSLLEEAVRRYILKKISRGRIEVFIKAEDTGNTLRELQVDKGLALAYYKSLKELAAITELPLEVSVVQIAKFPEVFKLEEPEEAMEAIWEDILPALRDALEILLEMREKEGQTLKEDLIVRLKILQDLSDKIAGKSPQVVDSYREKLTARLQEILEEGMVDETRLTMEVALFADKCNIDEELVRLNSHFVQLGQILEGNAAVGRKIDFLLQEINREINTIGSKANDLEITQYVVELKSELEKIREQVQNIE